MDEKTIEFKEYKNIVLNWESLVSGILVTILVAVVIATTKENGIVENLKNDITSLIVAFIATYFFVSIPVYVIKRFSNLKNEINQKLAKIDECPKMTALHTEEKTFEQKIKLLGDLEEPHQRWLLAKYISKMLAKSFESFKIMIDPPEYSEFSSDLFSESKKSVKLISSMHPSTWLHALAKDTSIEESFFSNQLRVDDYQVNEKNHAIILRGCNHIKERVRFVCLDKYDWKYLFISEKSVDAYYYINNNGSGLKTYFIIDANDEHIQPSTYEYALYDEELLLKWDTKELSLVMGEKNKELIAVKEFFAKHIKESKKNDYYSIKLKIQNEKISYLNKILNDHYLPHKLSYIYNGGEEWIKYIRVNGIKYADKATKAIEEGLIYFRHKIILNDNKISVLEIGPGSGERISTICDCIRSNNIKEYFLLDISRRLLDTSKSVLQKRIPNTFGESQIIPIDCCEDIDKLQNSVLNKFVIIPMNSTLFTEPGFDLNNLRSASSIFITLDMYKENESYDDHIKALELFLNPLKIFEIPIEKDIIVKFERFLFKGEYENTKQIFNIFFNLKMYIGLVTMSITESDISNFTDNFYSTDNSILWREIRDFHISKKINIFAPSNGNLKKGTLYSDYMKKRKDFFNIKKLRVLSSLKFEDESTFLASNIFQIEGFDMEYKISEDRNFISILLTRNR
jgi:hypothetical protein